MMRSASETECRSAVGAPSPRGALSLLVQCPGPGDTDSEFHKPESLSQAILTGLDRLLYSWLWETEMRTHNNDRLKGTLDLLVLKALAVGGKMHGYAITLRIEQVSESVLRVEEGSLYPALHRMTQAGWLRSEWGASENNRRARYYSITTAGRRRLTEEMQEWEQLTEAVARVLSLA